ncbi:dicarboxylate/amino acid:cation symporter [Legionella taurinensis]|uniref:Dicarboxylate/amino acid:cation symporter n=1 Tax=Legionella taurinensis TaxID=70611 RepID=A0A3A5LEF6_9GAMM|nr:dicarboxylate/amino acid:cation symporter [Legionella taurinensis]RJT43676.1 dicarboxylate/amino acid:cation symporter [Legionella taurinensis]RJT64761.1 dicarboxylate/amino acid:cation symporter [Legionella taurinensis]STY26596.1 amino acid transporter [Legionella taurinensis]
MCISSSSPKKIWLSTPVLYAVMIALGLLTGWSGIKPLQQFGLFIADVFINVFKCISLPIIALSIIVTLSNYRADGPMRRIWQRAMTYTLGTTLIAAAISCLLYILIHPSMVGSIQGLAAPKANDYQYLSHVANLIPSTIFSPFIEHQVMGVLLLGIVTGVAIRYIPDQDSRQTITQFFRGAHGLFMVITKWVIAVIPLGLYGFITATVIQLQNGKSIKGIGEYLLIVVLANLIQGFVVLPLWLKAHGIKPFSAMRAMLPALSLAFFSKSSVGTLPVTMETAEKNLAVKPAISRFVLPLCTSLNMNGCAAFIFATVIYLMQNHGMVISLPMMALWVLIATVAAIGNAGVPMGCFFLSTSLLASMNVPITLMGIILPFYSLIDMLETALNVWSDSCVAKVVNDKTVLEEEHETPITGTSYSARA